MAKTAEEPTEVKVIKPRKGKSSDSKQGIMTASTEVVQVSNTPDNLLAMAITKGMGIDAIEKFMDLHDRWQASIAKKAFFAAFTKFQSISPDLVKNKKASFDHRQGGGKTEYNFQELGDIAKHIREPLATCGLSYSFTQTEKEKQISVVCILKHIDGHEERGEPLSGEADSSGSKNVIQAKASTISYLKRYTLLGALGLSSMDPDDDGAGGKKIVKEAIKSGLQPPDDSQFKHLMDQAKKGKLDIEDVKKKYFALSQEHEDALRVAEMGGKIISPNPAQP